MTTTTPTTQEARVRHRCDLCSGPILPGSVYLRWRFYDGGEAGACKAHPTCDEEAREADWYDGGWTLSYPLLEDWDCEGDPRAEEVRRYWRECP